MRKSLRILRAAAFILSGTLVIASCGKSQQKAREDIAAQTKNLSKDLPTYMRAGYVLESISYDEPKNNVVYTYSVDTTYMPRAVFHERLATGKKKIIASMAEPDPEMQKFVSDIIAADASLIYVYTFSDGVTERIPVKASEIKEMLESIK